MKRCKFEVDDEVYNMIFDNGKNEAEKKYFWIALVGIVFGLLLGWRFL